LDLGKKSFLELVSCVEVTLVSKFHLIWCLIAEESKLRRRFLGVPDISDSFFGYIRQNQTYPVPDRICPLDSFQPDVHLLFWPYFANRVFIWSRSSFASFIILCGSFLSCWLVLFITFLQGFLLGTLNVGHRPISYEKFYSAPVHPLPPPVAPSVLHVPSKIS
jgi:hypothetical protein